MVRIQRAVACRARQGFTRSKETVFEGQRMTKVLTQTKINQMDLMRALLQTE